MTERAWLIPEWPGSVFEKWSKKFCATNAWRVHSTIGDFDDCMSECYLQYLYCRQHYPHVEAKHFNYMFMLACKNVFDTQATKDSNLRDAYRQLPKYERGYEGEAQLALKLGGASEELKSVMKIFLEAPAEVMEVLRKEVASSHPKQAFRQAVRLAGISVEKAAFLAKELQRLLAK